MKGRGALIAVVAALVGASCGSDGGGTIEVLGARLVAEPQNVLSAVLEFQTSDDARPRVWVSGPRGRFEVPGSGWLSGRTGRAHQVLVLGLTPETAYELEIGGAHVRADRSIAFTTPPAPSALPTLEVRTRDAEHIQPGITLIGISGPEPGWIAAYDDEGQPVWYHHPDPPVIVTHVQRLRNGHFAYVAGTNWERLREIDVRGRTVREWDAHAMGLDTLHHDFDELPDGHLLAQTTNLVPVSGFPPGGGDGGPNTLELVADSLLELDGESRVVRRWPMLETLAPHRILLDALFPYWNDWYPGSSLVRGWCHLNNVTYLPDTDGVLLSALNQRLVFEMGLADGRLRWVLGEDDPRTTEDDDWPYLALEEGGRYPARQHDVERLPDGDILVYDNAIDTLKSRCVRYRIDPERRTARQVWEFIDPELTPPAFSLVAGDCDGLANGHILVWDPMATAGVRSRLAEVDPATNTKVWEAFTAPLVGGFDAERLPSIYPD